MCGEPARQIKRIPMQGVDCVASTYSTSKRFVHGPYAGYSIVSASCCSRRFSRHVGGAITNLVVSTCKTRSAHLIASVFLERIRSKRSAKTILDPLDHPGKARYLSPSRTDSKAALLWLQRTARWETKRGAVGHALIMCLSRVAPNGPSTHVWVCTEKSSD